MTYENQANHHKKDLYNVFVMGNADDRQLARVYLLLAVPLFALLFSFGHFPVYR